MMMIENMIFSELWKSCHLWLWTKRKWNKKFIVAVSWSKYGYISIPQVVMYIAYSWKISSHVPTCISQSSPQMILIYTQSCDFFFCRLLFWHRFIWKLAQLCKGYSFYKNRCDFAKVSRVHVSYFQTKLCSQVGFCSHTGHLGMQ